MKECACCGFMFEPKSANALYCDDPFDNEGNDPTTCKEFMRYRRDSNIRLFGVEGLKRLGLTSSDVIPPTFRCSFCDGLNLKESERGWFKCIDGCDE